jgi:hypothetical protein
MSVKANLLLAHKAMLAVLDAKFAKVQEWQAFRNIDKALIGLIEEGGAVPNQTTHGSRRRQVVQRDSLRPNSRAARARVQAKAVLLQLKRPVPLQELYDAVAARGVPLGGKHPSRRLSAILGGDNDFVSTPQGWWLSEMQVPPAAAAKPASRAPAETQSLQFLSTYPDLAVAALNQYGHPLPTPDMIQFIGQRRTLKDDSRRTVVNITSSFSHDKRLTNIKWNGSRAWWFADVPVPTDPSTPDGEMRLNANGLELYREPDEFEIPKGAA